MSRQLYRFIFFYVVYGYSLFFLSLMKLINPLSVCTAAIWGLLLSIWIAKSIDSIYEDIIPKWDLVLFLPMLHVCFVPHFLRDDLIYHLYIPKRILIEGQMFIDTFHINTNFPYLFELPLMAFELLKPYLSFNLVNLIILFFLSRLLFRLIKKWGTVDLSRSCQILILISLLTQPAIYRLCLSSYVELFLTLLILLGFFHYHRYDSEGQTQDWFLALSFLSFACSVKYIGVFFLGMVILREFFVKKNDRIFYLGVFFSFLIFCPFYIKNFLVTGNPVFPFASAFFPSEFLTINRYLLFMSLLGSPSLNVESIIAPVSLFTGFFTSESSRTITASCALSFLFVISFLGLGFKIRWQRFISLVFGIYFIVWVTTSQQSRFILPALMLLFPLGIQRLARIFSPTKFNLFLKGLMLLTLVQNAFNNHTTMRDLKIYDRIMGFMSPDEFRAHHNPISTHFAKVTKGKLDPKRNKLWMIGNFGRAYDYDIPVLANTGFDTELISLAFDRKNIRFDILKNFLRHEGLTHIQFDRQFFNKFYEQDKNIDWQLFLEYLQQHTKVIYSYQNVELIEILKI